MRALGPCFISPAGVAFGVDVGDLLELEGAFEGDGVVDAAAEEEEVVGGGEGFGELVALVVDGAENLFDLAGELAELVDEVEGFRIGDGSADLGEVEGEDEEGGELGGEGLGGGDADLGAGVGGDGALGFAGDGGADDVADGEGLGAFGDELALGGDGVGGFAGLGDEEADGVGVGDGVAVAVLAGVVDVDGEAGEAFDHELAGEAGVPGGSAGGDGDLAGVLEVGFGDLHGGEVDAAGFEGDAAEGGVADGAGLLVDLLEHEVLVAGFFGLDGVPGDALDFEGEGCGVEVGEGDAVAGEDGEFAVGEEVDVAGVVEDAGDVGGEEELAFADADDGGWAHAGGDELVGLVGGEDADGEGSGDALDGAADGLFEGDGGLQFVEGEDGFGDVGFGGGLDAVALGSGGEVELVFDEVGDDLGVGLGDELVAFGDEGVFEGDVVFDDAVVDDDEGAGAVAVGGGRSLRWGRPWVAQRVWPMPKEPSMGDSAMTASRLRSLPGARRRARPSGPPATAMPAES